MQRQPIVKLVFASESPTFREGEEEEAQKEMHKSEGKREGCTVGRYRKRLRVERGDTPT